MCLWRTYHIRTSLVVQWLRFPASIAGDVGSISGPGIKIPQAVWPKKKKRNKRLSHNCHIVCTWQNLIITSELPLSTSYNISFWQNTLQFLTLHTRNTLPPLLLHAEVSGTPMPLPTQSLSTSYGIPTQAYRPLWKLLKAGDEQYWPHLLGEWESGDTDLDHM